MKESRGPLALIKPCIKIIINKTNNVFGISFETTISNHFAKILIENKAITKP